MIAVQMLFIVFTCSNKIKFPTVLLLHLTGHMHTRLGYGGPVRWWRVRRPLGLHAPCVCENPNIFEKCQHYVNIMSTFVFFCHYDNILLTTQQVPENTPTFLKNVDIMSSFWFFVFMSTFCRHYFVKLILSTFCKNVDSQQNVDIYITCKSLSTFC